MTGARIAALAVDDDLALRAAFDLSYRTLPPVARLVFRRLGLVPYPDFTVAAAAALADIVESVARHALEALTAAHLVVRHASGRYTMHDLLREYAADVAADQDSATEREAATRRLDDLLFGPGSAAAALMSPYRRGKPRNGHQLGMDVGSSMPLVGSLTRARKTMLKPLKDVDMVVILGGASCRHAGPSPQPSLRS